MESVNSCLICDATNLFVNINTAGEIKKEKIIRSISKKAESVLKGKTQCATENWAKNTHIKTNMKFLIFIFLNMVYIPLILNVWKKLP